MDSGINDYFRLGRRLRPATEDFAVANFPKMILRLKQNRLIVGADTSPDNPAIMLLRNPSVRHEAWCILKSDFDICKNIADQVSLHLFPGDNEDTIVGRILGYVKSAFAGRGVPSSV